MTADEQDPKPSGNAADSRRWQPDGQRLKLASALRRYGLSGSLLALRLGPVLLLLLVGVGFASQSSLFMSIDNLRNIFSQSCIVGALALGMLPLILTRSLDLSVSSTIALSTLICAKFYVHNPSLGALVIPMFLGVGLLVGALNALLIIKLRLASPIIVTLGTLYVVQSLADVLSNGASITGMPPTVLAIANNTVLGIPLQVLVIVGCGVAMAVILRLMKWGRWIYAIGGNPEAAERVGIPVRRILISTYLFAGVFAGIAGMLTAGDADGGYTVAGQNMNLSAIAACVVGGVSLAGGRGGVIGALVGALVLGTISNGLTLTNVSSNWDLFVIGAILIFAVAVDVARRELERRLQLRQAELMAAE